MKKVLLTLLLIIVALAGFAYYYLGSINSIVKEQIEKHGTSSLQTTVAVGAVNIQILDGLGEISDFSIANPNGFSDASALGFKKIRLDIGTESITEMPIVIEEILIDSVSTLYELNASGQGNLNTLLDQIGSNPSTNEMKTDDSDSSPNSPSDIRIVLKKLSIKDTQLALDLSAIGQEKYDETLPSFTINNIGGTKGLPPEQLAEAMGKSLLDKIIKEAKEKQTEKLKNKAKEKYHTVKKGETMRDISQLYGVKLKKLYKKNRMFMGTQPNIGDKIHLKSKKR